MELLECRVCLVTGTNFSSLSSNVKTAFEGILGRNINENNGLPEHICPFCKTRVLQYAQFKKCCQYVQEQLENVPFEIQETKDMFKAVSSSLPGQRLTKTEISTFFVGGDIEMGTEKSDDYVEDYNDDDSCYPNEEKVNTDEYTETSPENKLPVWIETNIKNESALVIKTVNLKESNRSQEAEIIKNKDNVKTENSSDKMACFKRESEENKDSIIIDSDILPLTTPDIVNIVSEDESSDENFFTNKNIKIDTIKTQNFKLHSTTITKVSNTNNKYSKAIEQCVKANNIEASVDFKSSNIKSSVDVKLKNIKSSVDASKSGNVTRKEGKLRKERKLQGEPLRVKVGKWQCTKCKYFFLTEQALRTHMDNCSSGEKSQGQPKQNGGRPCGVCGVSFPDFRSLHEHTKEHNPKKNNVACQQCGMEFRSLMQLKKHWVQAHYSKERRSPSPRPPRAKDKLRRSEPGKPEGVVCDQCGKRYQAPSQLRRHMTGHTGEKPFQCDVCPKSFRVETSLRTHKYMHSGEKPFTCAVCGVAFRQTSHLARHMRRHKYSHTGERPYKCKECDMRFKDTSHLSRHRRIHTGEKPFHCPICSKAFANSSNKKEHVRTVHEGLPSTRRPGKIKKKSKNL